MPIYLDHNATAPLRPQVLESMLPWLQGRWGNASSAHGPGREALKAVEQARAQVAGLLNCRPEEIVFTGGGTEANNLALRGACLARRKQGDHVIVSAVEHHSVLRCAEDLAGQGFQLTRLPVDEDGLVRPESLESALTGRTILVSIMHANNEIGTIQPLQRLGEALRKRSILFHTDAVQSAGKVPVDVRRLGADLLSLSAHKIHGPQGVGALFVRQGVSLRPILHGGGQESGLRPGTYNLAGIVGLGTAALLAGRGLAVEAAYLEAQRDRLEQGIRELEPRAVFLGAAAPRLPNTSSVCFPGRDNQALAANLDLRGIAVSTGAACGSGDRGPSHVLKALGLDPALARSVIRFSLGGSTSMEEISETLATLKAVLAESGR
ncbi:MAG: cysteine desulfurase family protein [Elusimicrobia bacterium]|nr:cysteine desulfurase family protein [Elusimicrobiota bacterium]